MLIIAHHNIHDPEGFWNAAKESTKNLPEGMKLHSVYPSTDGKTGTCIREANNVKEIDDFLDEHASKYANNFCYELNAAGAMNLPAIGS